MEAEVSNFNPSSDPSEDATGGVTVETDAQAQDPIIMETLASDSGHSSTKPENGESAVQPQTGIYDHNFEFNIS